MQTIIISASLGPVYSKTLYFLPWKTVEDKWLKHSETTFATLILVHFGCWERKEPFNT